MEKSRRIPAKQHCSCFALAKTLQCKLEMVQIYPSSFAVYVPLCSLLAVV